MLPRNPSVRASNALRRPRFRDSKCRRHFDVCRRQPTEQVATVMAVGPCIPEHANEEAKELRLNLSRSAMVVPYTQDTLRCVKVLDEMLLGGEDQTNLMLPLQLGQEEAGRITYQQINRIGAVRQKTEHSYNSCKTQLVG